MNKKIIGFIVIIIVISGGAFWGGMKYTESKGFRNRFSQGSFQNLQNLSSEERQQRLQELSANSFGATFRGGVGQRGGNIGGFVSGEIISKDTQSITIKLSDGGSKIVFYSDSTEINKSVKGISSDLQTGKTVTINGKTNQDGSITAEFIQVR